MRPLGRPAGAPGELDQGLAAGDLADPELKKPDSPIARHLRERFPNVHDLRRRYAEAVAGLAPIEPRPGARVAYRTLGTAFDWQVRFLVEPAPDLHLALAGARLAGKDLFSLCGVLMAEVGGSFTIVARSGPAQRRPAAPAEESRAAALDAERLARACWALALFTEVYRSHMDARSPLGLLDPGASLEELLALASADEIADLLALAGAARGCWYRRWPPAAARYMWGRRSPAASTWPPTPT
jgi:hypothetical protein